MCIYNIEDTTGIMDGILFPQNFKKFGLVANIGDLVCVIGKCVKRDGSFSIHISDIKKLSLQSSIENAKTMGVYDIKKYSVDEVRKNLDIKNESLNKKDCIEEQDYIIELSENIEKEKLLMLKEFLEEKNSEGVSISFKINDKIIKTNYKIPLDKDFKIKLSDIL